MELQAFESDPASLLLRVNPQGLTGLKIRRH